MAHDTSTSDDRFRQLSALLGAGNGTTDLLRFAALVYTPSTLDDVEPTDIAMIAGDLPDTLAFITDKPKAQHKIRVRPSNSRGATIVELLNDDMPFLVDSVMAEIQSRGHEVRIVAHPILKMMRDASGRIAHAASRSGATRTTTQPESLIIVYLPAISAEASRDLEAAISESLVEVRSAVGDWDAMQARTKQALAALEVSGKPVDGAATESIAFLRWILAGNFVFLGMYEEGHAPDSPLGICRSENLRAGIGIPFVEARPAAGITIAKSSQLSRVHRRALMDYVAITIQPGKELRIVGLFTSSAYTQPAQSIPLVRSKIKHVLSSVGYSPLSHAGKALQNVLDTFPRDELFQMSEGDLVDWARGVLDLDLRPRVRMFARRDAFNRFISVLLYAPRERWNTDVRERIGALLADSYKGTISSYHLAFPEGPLMRAHFIVANGSPSSMLENLSGLERAVSKILRTWNDELADGLMPLSANAPHLEQRYLRAFPRAYAESIDPIRAIEDVQRIERLATTGQPVAIDFYRRPEEPPHRVNAAVYRFGAPIKLSERVPVLENLGFTVIDERSFAIAPSFAEGTRQVALHDMVLETADSKAIDLGSHDQRLEETYLAVDRLAAESDQFNRLVIDANATWREAQLVRAYAAYLRQLNVPFGLRYIAETMVRHATITRDLIELFRIRFDPATELPVADRQRQASDVAVRIHSALSSVPSLDEDRILRQMLNLVESTLRTNFFRPEAATANMPVIALKLDSKSIEAAPRPRPYREIWVYSPRVEGVHLRFGPIARGGIRWSDRAQDFRTEVLGLVKAQLVKNAVIVPSGAKGGFLPKQLPRNASRDDVMREGIAAYKMFVSSLLDITDNIVGEKLIPPDNVVRHDGDDPYLVVAADKGTATFSDFANEISAEHHHWLGDAFASGGSAGYDHKKMGITARGAWECVSRHFQEMDWNIQTKPFRVAGVGDMSGDVFGNGMLLSPVIQLVAAFDHRDIFIDPTPDTAVSFAERKRLFDLPRSSWQDYDKAKISPGGGVFSRSAKSISLTPEIKALLAIDATSVTPAELMRAIIKSPVDLMWFGGIGTYIKASSESDEQAGDRTNDSIRVTGLEVSAKVVGEGANLGITQRGRIELAQRGVRLNTDFIDNSAGVNSSDYEVNIKIALGDATRSGRLTASKRTAFLASMTDEVAAGCLANNRDQALALSLAEQSALADSTDHGRLMKALERRHLLDRRLEQLPTDAELARRQTAGTPLSRPELAVLLSYSKIALTEDLLASRVPDSPSTASLLTHYFPKTLVSTYPEGVSNHRLKREIIATALTNAVINRAGPATPVAIAEETGRTTSDIALAFRGVEQAFGLGRIWERLNALSGRINGALYLSLEQDVRRVLVYELRQVASDPKMLSDFDGSFATLKKCVERLLASLGAILTDKMRAESGHRISTLTSAGVPADVAKDLVSLALIADAPRINHLAANAKCDVVRAAAVFLQIGEGLQLDVIRARAAQLSLNDSFDRMAVNTAVNQLSKAQASFARSALAAGQVAPEKWLASQQDRLSGAMGTLERIAADPVLTASRLTVAAAQFAGIVDEPAGPI